MVATGTAERVEEIASSLFEVLAHVGLAVPRPRRRGADLKEVEFLTLDFLQQYRTMIVGDIQRLLGVLPAQMSRIIRALESRQQPLIACQINPQDKRKINVSLTPHGEQALEEYRADRVRRIVEVLQRLPEDEREDLSQVLGRLEPLVTHNGG
jgi:DNA-binding MarR family transcriptional regulator